MTLEELVRIWDEDKEENGYLYYAWGFTYNYYKDCELVETGEILQCDHELDIIINDIKNGDAEIEDWDYDTKTCTIGWSIEEEEDY